MYSDRHREAVIVLRERLLGEVAIPGSVGGGGWPDSGVVDEAQVTVSGGRLVASVTKVVTGLADYIQYD